MDKNAINDLVIEYFKSDILNSNLDKETKELVLKTFTYAHEKKLHIRAIIHELEGSRLSEIRNRIIERLGSNYNPYPVRLGELKPMLQMEACENNKSLHGQVLKILREYYELKEMCMSSNLKP